MVEIDLIPLLGVLLAVVVVECCVRRIKQLIPASVRLLVIGGMVHEFHEIHENFPKTKVV